MQKFSICPRTHVKEYKYFFDDAVTVGFWVVIVAYPTMLHSNQTAHLQVLRARIQFLLWDLAMLRLFHTILQSCSPPWGVFSKGCRITGGHGFAPLRIARPWFRASRQTWSDREAKQPEHDRSKMNKSI